jgi:hypothetical protein
MHSASMHAALTHQILAHCTARHIAAPWPFLSTYAATPSISRAKPPTSSVAGGAVCGRRMNRYAPSPQTQGAMGMWPCSKRPAYRTSTPPATAWQRMHRRMDSLHTNFRSCITMPHCSSVTAQLNFSREAVELAYWSNVRDGPCVYACLS